MRKKLRKRKGELPEHMIVVFLGILSFFIIILASMNDISAIDKYIEANRVARKYMLKVESSGYLNQDNANKLKNELENLGLSNINLSGTTMTEVNNGEDVYLDIKYDEKVKEIGIDGFNIRFKNKIKTVEIPLSSTAKNQ